MRILVADNHEDGMYKCRGELLDELVKIAEVYISVPKGKYTQALIEKGCRFENLEISRRSMNPFQELKLVNSYRKLLSRVKPDVVLTYSIKPNVYLGFLCGLKSIPYIANVTGLGSSIQNGGLISRLTVFLYQIGLKKASMVFCQNNTNRSFLLDRHIIQGPCELIPGSGVNLIQHCFEEYPPDTKRLRFLTIGRLMKDKGTDELLEAAKIVKTKYPDVSFSLIGFFDGDYKDIVETAEAEGLVTYFGHQDDVHSFIKRSHAIVHPSYHEGMANALLESAASGRPVIASDIPGCREALEPGRTGFACQPKNAESLAASIMRFIELPYQQKREMGIAAREKMEREFNREFVVEKYLNQIQIIDRGRSTV